MSLNCPVKHKTAEDCFRVILYTLYWGAQKIYIVMEVQRTCSSCRDVSAKGLEMVRCSRIVELFG